MYLERFDKRHYLEGVVRYGRITRVDSARCAATVTYPDMGYQTNYLPFLQRNTYGHQTYEEPIAGETAVVLHPQNSPNWGVILGSIYNKNNPPPQNSATQRGIWFKDGTYIIYDTASGGNYTIHAVGKVTINAATSVTITVPNIKLAGDVEITGNLTVDGSTTTVHDINILGTETGGGPT